jgi:hypothetical protein
MLFVKPDLQPKDKAHLMLRKKPQDVCRRNAETLVNFCQPHPELQAVHTYWSQVLQEILSFTETFQPASP